MIFTKHRFLNFLINNRLLLFLFTALALLRCPVVVWDPSAFRTGKVLEKGKVEIETRSILLHDFFSIPNIAIAYGLPNNFEIRGRLGFRHVTEYDYYDYYTQRVFTGEVNLTKGISKSSKFFTSASLELEVWYFYKWYFYEKKGYDEVYSRMGGCYAFGYYPRSWMGVYLPLKIAMFKANDYSALAFVPGIGFSYEPRRPLLRLGSNFPLPLAISPNFELWPYVGGQVGFRF